MVTLEKYTDVKIKTDVNLLPVGWRPHPSAWHSVSATTPSQLTSHFIYQAPGSLSCSFLATGAWSLPRPPYPPRPPQMPWKLLPKAQSCLFSSTWPSTNICLPEQGYQDQHCLAAPGPPRTACWSQTSPEMASLLPLLCPYSAYLSLLKIHLKHTPSKTAFIRISSLLLGKPHLRHRTLPKAAQPHCVGWECLKNSIRILHDTNAHLPMSIPPTFPGYKVPTSLARGALPSTARIISPSQEPTISCALISRQS